MSEQSDDADRVRRDVANGIGECEYCGGQAHSLFGGEHIWKCSNIVPVDELRDLLSEWETRAVTGPNDIHRSAVEMCADDLRMFLDGTPIRTDGGLVTDRDPAEMDHDELRNEWHDIVEALTEGLYDKRDGPLTPEDKEPFWDRRRELWNEMKSRVDAEAPECPECGSQQWSQSVGDPKHCGGCGLELGARHEEHIREIDEHWLTVKTGAPGGRDG